jgi:hypothetical protein
VEHKVFPPALFKYVRGFDLFCVNMFVTGSFVYAINTYWPIFSQNVYARPGNYTDIGVLGIEQGGGIMTGQAPARVNLTCRMSYTDVYHSSRQTFTNSAHHRDCVASSLGRMFMYLDTNFNWCRRSIVQSPNHDS